MKILHVGPNSVHVCNFIQALNEHTSLTSFLLTDSKLEDQKINNMVIDMHSLNPLKISLKLQGIKRYLQNLMPDVIHIHQVNRMAFWTARIAKKMNIPLIVTAWGSDVLLMPKQNKLYYYLVKSTLTKAKIITADAQLMIDAMRKLAPDKKYVWLQYGIEPIESKLKGKIIYSNRLHKPLYRINRIIDLFAEFHNSHPDWILKIGASGTETEVLKAKVLQYGLGDKVEFLGWLDSDTNKIHYQTASIYISIPESDGTSVSLLEAMSAGCIPVLSDLPANREWVENGKNGVIWDGQNNPLEKALTLNQDLAKNINAALIETKATRAASIKQFIGIYEALKKQKG